MKPKNKKNRKKKNDKTKIALITLAILFFLSLPILISLVQKTQNTQQNAATSTPTLVSNEVVASDAFGDGSTYIPNGWGYQKTRIIRNSTGDIFVTYSNSKTQYAVMHRAPSGGWTQVNTGDQGSEPVNILRGPNDEIHVFPFPGETTLNDVASKDEGKTFTTTAIAGQWENSQGYWGAGTNAAGDMVIMQTENDQPYNFWWATLNPSTSQWTFHTATPPSGYSYVFVLPGASDISVVGMRDVHWSTLGLPAGGTFDYVFNELHLFHIASFADSTMTDYSLKEEQPGSNAPNEILYTLDSYLDTQNRLHILYWDANDQSDHVALVQNNALTKDVAIKLASPWKARMIQDTTGRFYILSIDNSTLDVYPGSAADTDGTQYDAAVALNLTNAGCNDDWDFCLPITLANPRSGVPLANYVDGIYGKGTDVYYFRVQLTNSSSSSSSPATSTAPTIVPSFVCGGSTNSICPTTTPAPSGITTSIQPSTALSNNPSINPSGITIPSISFSPSNSGRHLSGSKSLLALLLGFLSFLLDLILKLLGK
jgi:hypothetical protein